MKHLSPLVEIDLPSDGRCIQSGCVGCFLHISPCTSSHGRSTCQTGPIIQTRGLTLLAILGIFIISCSLATPNKQDTLKESVLLFNEGVRWGRLQDVMPRVAPEHADNFVEMHKDFGETIEISDYEIVNTTANWKEKRAEVTVQITWYRNTEMELYTTVLSQQWEQVGVEWVMMAESYVSGKPLI